MIDIRRCERTNSIWTHINVQPNFVASTNISDFAQIIKCTQNRCAGRCVHKKWLSILFQHLFNAFNQIVDAHASICIAFHRYQIIGANAQPMHCLLNAVMWFVRRECNQWLLTETAARFDCGHSTIARQNHSIPVNWWLLNCIFFSRVSMDEQGRGKATTHSSAPLTYWILSHPVRICHRHYHRIQTNCKTSASFRFPSMWIRGPLQMCICVECTTNDDNYYICVAFKLQTAKNISTLSLSYNSFFFFQIGSMHDICRYVGIFSMYDKESMKKTLAYLLAGIQCITYPTPCQTVRINGTEQLIMELRMTCFHRILYDCFAHFANLLWIDASFIRYFQIQ